VEITPHFFDKGAFLRLSGIPINDLSREVPVVRLEYDSLDDLDVA
jgi:hypothetical protein